MSAQIENLSPNVIKRLVLELQEISKEQLEGIRIVPNEADVSDILAILEGPEGTPYEGGYFRVKLRLGSEFPAQPPKGFFMTKIFHPNVSDKGEICVNTLKKDWKENLGIKHVLLTIKCLMIIPNPDSALNPEASRLMQESHDEYCRHAAMITSIHAQKPKDLVLEGPASCASEVKVEIPKKANVKSAPKKGSKNVPNRSLKRL
eukprot:TRINITY_DN1633_c0_g1_i2.p1 TRINITY_DN1633_c0_g1~~TRINITY_DN1633_c0_g1_i2.p1  ORF type:complete len:204 (-),score=30.70 TRINITY_DN1633_c0_g1_i2:119-730(-)